MKFNKDTKAEISSMEIVIGATIGLIVLSAVFSLAPVIGDQIDNSVELSDTSVWADESVPTGIDLWTECAPLIPLVILIIIMTLALLYMSRMGGGNVGRL